MKELELLESLGQQARQERVPRVQVALQVEHTLAVRQEEPQIVPLVMASVSLSAAAAAMFCVVSIWATLQSPWAGYLQSLSMLMH